MSLTCEVEKSNKKGRWNHTDKTKKQMSEKRIEFYKSGGKHPRGMLGKRSWNYIGKKWICKDCGKAIAVRRIRCKKCARKGILNPRWLGGKSFEPYTLDWTINLRISIRERDHYICQLCGVKQNDIAHCVHHIDYDKKNCNQDNLITLCKNCHSKTNSNRKYWENYFGGNNNE